MAKDTRFGISVVELPLNYLDSETVLLAIEHLRDEPRIDFYTLSVPLVAYHLTVEILKKNYYLDWTSLKAIQLSQKLNSPITLHDIEKHIKAFIASGFLDADMYERHGILTSVAIQDLWKQRRQRNRQKCEIHPAHRLVHSSNKELVNP